MTTAHLRAEAESVHQEAGGELTTRVALLLGAADEIDRLERIATVLNSDEFAARVARQCNDPQHDDRWCPTCEGRDAGIDAYRTAVAGAAAVPAGSDSTYQFLDAALGTEWRERQQRALSNVAPKDRPGYTGKWREAIGCARREAVCQHPWHNNPGLITPCPECGAVC